MTLFCDLDAGGWAKANPIRLYPGTLQRWTLVGVVPASDSDSAVASMAKRRIAGWLADASGQRSLADTIEVTRVAQTPPPAQSNDQRRESLAPVPYLRSVASNERIVYVTATFAYRGLADAMPWPVRSAAPMVSCPIGADWMVESASGASAGAAPPTPPPWPWDEAAQGPAGTYDPWPSSAGSSGGADLFQNLGTLVRLGMVAGVIWALREGRGLVREFR